MPTPGQMAAGQMNQAQRAMMEQMTNRRGDIMGSGPQVMSQAEGVLAARVADLVAEVRELRQMLAPPSAVILTGAEVAEHFKRLRAGGA